MRQDKMGRDNKMRKINEGERKWQKKRQDKTRLEKLKSNRISHDQTEWIWIVQKAWLTL